MARDGHMHEGERRHEHDGGHRRRRGRERHRDGRPHVAHNAPTSENISLFAEDGENEYADAVGRGHRRDPRAQKIFVMCVALVVMYVIALLMPTNIVGKVVAQVTSGQPVQIAWIIDNLQSNVNGIVAFFAGSDEGIGYSKTIFRYIVVVLAGAGLALCGAVYQGSFRNALVSPSSMGVMSGASAGMLLWVLFFVSDDGSNVSWISNIDSQVAPAAEVVNNAWAYLWSTYSLSIYSFIGCALIAGLVLLTMMLSRKSSTSGIMIIITGQVFGGIIGAFTSMTRYYMTEVGGFEEKLQLLNSISIGSFYRDYTWIDLVAVGIPIALCVTVVMLLRQRMMVLSLGNEEARSMGVDSKRIQIVVVAASTLLTAIIISFCGRIGFVGFLIPHLARRMVGPNFKYLLPACMALGGLFVLVAYLLVSATLGPDYETMVGMFISIFGSVIFLAQALRGVGGGGGLGRGARQ